MLLVLFIPFLVSVVSSEIYYIDDQYDYDNYKFTGEKPKFDKKLYTAKVVGDNDVEIEGAPITLLRCGLYPFEIRVVLGNNTFYSVIATTEYTATAKDCPIVSNFSIGGLIEDNYIRKKLFNILKIQAIYYPYIVTESDIIATSSTTSFIYKINEETYLILNYAWSIGLLVYLTLTISLYLICLTIFIVKKSHQIRILCCYKCHCLISSDF
ncbi:hypothetical protein NQ317_017906 [Molorchus minor]|uniref:Uncharacterized protein n=1 Tax=Molorchus minor TaxID=1323400 RepID=A0ABQ9J7T9_9CUCU|nr:hypothetical protein NQ317_017906 [Molorchus minor]